MDVIDNQSHPIVLGVLLTENASTETRTLMPFKAKVFETFMSTIPSLKLDAYITICCHKLK